MCGASMTETAFIMAPRAVQEAKSLLKVEKCNLIAPEELENECILVKSFLHQELVSQVTLHTPMRLLNIYQR